VGFFDFLKSKPQQQSEQAQDSPASDAQTRPVTIPPTTDAIIPPPSPEQTPNQTASPTQPQTQPPTIQEAPASPPKSAPPPATTEVKPQEGRQNLSFHLLVFSKYFGRQFRFSSFFLENGGGLH